MSFPFGDSSKMFNDPEASRGLDLKKQVRKATVQPQAEVADAPGVDIEAVQMFKRVAQGEASKIAAPRGVLARIREFFSR